MAPGFSTASLDELQRIGFIPAALPRILHLRMSNRLLHYRRSTATRLQLLATPKESTVAMRLPMVNVLIGLHACGHPVGFLIVG
jgi:hypothetical protein